MSSRRPFTQGFTWVRLIAALWVVFCHSAPLAGASIMYPGWFFVPEHMGLTAFFVLSGYQIAGSWADDPSIGRFVFKRLLRILPPLIVMSMVAALVIGPLVTNWPLDYYFDASKTWAYVLNNATVLNLQHTLPGVFDYNPYPYSVNGSIWTLPIELVGYVIVLILGVVGVIKRWRSVTVVLLVAVIAFNVWLALDPRTGTAHWLQLSLGSTAKFMMPFVLGVTLYAYRDRIPLSPKVAGALVAVQLVINATAAGEFLTTLTIAYAALTLAARWPERLAARDKDWFSCSYGTYLYGFLIQQTLAYLGVWDKWMLAVLAVPLAYAAGLTSWHLVEKPTMKLRSLLPKPARTPVPALVREVAPTYWHPAQSR
ncbi:acyltransferase family protein [Lentzea sp. NPDC058436]|uniref:acyltransferase family protein n=1 Tax=Lentzea sp. NPDC058436 TaxID=3346499 RepID=UPI00364E8EF4